MMLRKRIFLVLLLVLGGGGLAYGQEPQEAQDLQRRERMLSEQVRSLKAEQQQLLLRKALYSADSKYLELDLRSGEGSLRYRSRILRSFRFTRRGTGPDREKEGPILSLTAKEDGSVAKRRLLFGNAALVIEGKTHRGVHAANSLYISASRRDLAAIYYALEVGSFAYVKE